MVQGGPGPDRGRNAFDPDEDEGARLAGQLTGHAEAVTAVKWCEWRELWVTASNDRTFRLWCPRALETTRCLKFRGDSITAMALDASNGKVLAAMTDRKVRVFDLARMEGRKDKHGNWIDDGVKGDEELDGGEGDQIADGEKKATEAEEDAPAAPEGKEQSKVEEPPAPRVPNFAGAHVDDDAEADHIFCGHVDLIRAIVCAPGKGQYMTAGCDGDVRVWLAPNNPNRTLDRPNPIQPGSEGVDEFDRPGSRRVRAQESPRSRGAFARRIRGEVIARQLEEGEDGRRNRRVARVRRREREMSTRVGSCCAGCRMS